MEGRKLLFVIGIDNYSSPVWSNLNNAVLDCQELSRVLIDKYSFEEVENPLFNEEATKAKIYTSLNTIKQIIEPEDSLIVFFAGHGNMNPHTKRGYWIPHEGTADPSSWIENSVIKDHIQDINSRHIWLLADSCFSGTFLTTTRGIRKEEGYIVLNQKKSRWMISSGGEEKVSDGSPKSHSPFCKYLLKALNQNTNKYLSATEVMLYTKVLTENNSHQTPHWAFIENIGHLDGEMILELKREHFQTEIQETRGIPNSQNLRAEISQYTKRKERLTAGKEILLVESFVEGSDYLILENFRFDDDGNKKIQFENEHVIIGSERIKLVKRFATWVGVNRFLDLNPEFSKSSRIGVIKADEEVEHAESQDHSLSYSDYLQELLEFNKDKMTCLHCGEKISTNDSLLVELDEINLKNNVGNVHIQCLRNADRILGVSGYEGLEDTRLVNFDYSLWTDLLPKGQGQLRAIYNKINSVPVAIVSWNPANNINDGKFCIRINYENGETSFVKMGKELHRFKKDEIDDELEFFRNMLGKDDPWGMIVPNKTFGAYSTLSKLMKPNDSFVKVKGFEKALYSKQYEDSNEITENDYTPIGLVKDEDDKPIVLGEMVPLLSKPEDFDVFIENWQLFTEIEGKFSIKIIKTDFELDTYLQSFFRENLKPVINPMFSKDGNSLESGLLLKSMDEIIQEGRERTSVTPNWREGDKVKVVFPDVKTDKHATGVLLVDEFQDENGELCTIFQPIENGKPIEDMQFKLPVKLLERWK